MTKRKSKRRQRPRRQKRSQVWPYLLLGTLVLAFMAVVAAMFAADNRSATRPPATPVPTVPQSDTGHEAGEIPYPEVPRISPAEVRAQYDAGTALFVDVRSQGEYETAHIPNAISLPLADLKTRYRELPRDAEIITYCACPSEESSARAAFLLKDKGYTNVKALLGGLRAWQTTGYPVVSGQ